MWKSTTRSKIKTIKKQDKSISAENKVATRPPFMGVDYILPGGIGGYTDIFPDIGEITYYSVLKILSEAIGKLPIHVVDSEHKIVKNATEKLLAIRPNETMTMSTLLCLCEYNRNHYGNAYCYCKWSDVTGELQSITALDPRRVRIWLDDVSGDILQKFYYTYTAISGTTYIIPAEDMIHLRAWHLDEQTNFLGVPVRDTLHEYMTSAKAGQEVQKNLYENGMISSATLNYVGDLSDEKKQILLEQIRKIGTKNKVIPLPAGWEIKGIGSLSMADAQYVEARTFSLRQISAALGVPSSFLNDTGKTSYSSASAEQLAFLNTTLMFIVRQYESEFTYKLLSDDDIEKGLRIDIDTDAILANTPDILSNILAKLVSSSIMTINEARHKANLPSIGKDGDKLMTMPGSTTLKEEVIV